MRVEWTDRAIAELESIVIYIGRFDEDAAFRIFTRLRNATNVLSDHPRFGRFVGRGVRQLSSIYPYLIRYRVRRDHIEIITVRHGARR